MWLWARGTEDYPVVLPGHAPLPAASRLSRQTVQGTFTPLEFVDVARVPTGRAGLHFATTPVGTSANQNFLEGCFYYFGSAASG